MTDNDEHDLIGSHLFGRTPPDLAPLVSLLKSDRQIPIGIRVMLAQMLDPAGDGYLYLKLRLEDAGGKIRNIDRDVQNQQIAAAHANLVESGKSSNEACTEVGAKFGIDPRNVYKRLNEAQATRLWLQGRV